MKRVRTAAPIVACLALLCVAPAHAQQANMTFFLTSAGPGKGADLGGLAGATGIASSSRHRWARGNLARISVHARRRAERARPYREGPWVNARV
jgi:hypothetical protein